MKTVEGTNEGLSLSASRGRREEILWDGKGIHTLGIAGGQTGMGFFLLNCQKSKGRRLVPGLVGNEEFLWAGIFGGATVVQLWA